MRALLAALAFGLVALGARAGEPDLRCPEGTQLRIEGDDAACETPGGVGEGPFYARHPNGRLRIHGTARRGRLHGPWTRWHPSGAPAIEAHYEDGVLVGPFRRFDAGGRLESEGVHDAGGEMHGTWTRYWPNGRPRTAWTMEHGIQHGPVSTWDEGGALRSRGRRSRGVLDGDFTRYRPDGSVAATCRYVRGALVDGDCADASEP